MVVLVIGRFYGMALACVKECVSDSLLLIRRYRASSGQAAGCPPEARLKVRFKHSRFLLIFAWPGCGNEPLI